MFLMTSCGKAPEDVIESVSETTSETTVERIMMSTEIGQNSIPEIEYSISKPIFEMTDSTSKEITFYRDGKPILGRITYPEGKGPFKTIVISSGLYAAFGRYYSKALKYSEYGYAVIEFQFQNGTPPPSYDDPEYLGDYVFDEILDLYAVIDSLAYIPNVDTSNIYLYGHSMGGLVTAYVGTLRQKEIRGLILVDPSFYASYAMNFEKEEKITTDIYSLITECRIPVVIITGTAGSFGEDPTFFDEERKAFPNCEYVVIEGANHRMDGEAGEMVVEKSVEVMKRWK